MQALCGLQGIFDLFNCKTPDSPPFCAASRYMAAIYYMKEQAVLFLQV